ncbi:GNAT family N-acetyltransferase [Haematobacter genomosp. 1]|uniref:GNAT family N-acetyltransferase n=1 Tax=Haematobacter genomosp. 1 TaxID=366618 RepID=UPI0015C5F534|nr:GNAT family N-acetyltransferase [Haematobacter genomosp. 1]
MIEARPPSATGSEAVTGIRLDPVTPADLPLLGSWLRLSHVRRWWDAPEEQLARIGERIGSPLISQQIASYYGQPFGYVQHYRLLDWPGGAGGLPEDTRGIDLLIGPSGRLGRGLGSGLLRALSARLFAEGVPALAGDPDPANIAAVRAFRRAGFRDYAAGSDMPPLMVLLANPTPDENDERQA